ncbi:MAG: UDP-N-acetylmuramate dehydrogenase [Clostridia bacterium]|nr:UDP-N-acetylmuramate dehydrogenase [Clostridia bacterium]
MGNAEFIKEIESRGISFSADEPMSKHTTFKIGGRADIFVLPRSEEELIFAVNAAKRTKTPFFVCGKGSDLLVSDNGIEGAVICLNEMKGIIIDKENVTVAAGQSVQSLCLEVQKAGLSGLQFAYGIPGTVGGAIYMNAGAYGGEFSDCTNAVKYLDESGEIKEAKREELNFGYRTSAFQKNKGIILSAQLKLSSGDPDKILREMNGYLSRRKEKQPLEYPSAGSVFRRPEGNFAGTLIEKSGLKGEKVGGAEVSKKHAGFIVNTGGATSKDVKTLIERIQKKVLKDSGVALQREVIYIGR